MHKVLDEDTIKPEILPQIVCGKTCLCSEGDLAEVIPCDLYKLKAWLSMTDNFCFSMMLFSLPVSNMHCNRSRWPLQAYMFSVSLPTRACLRHNSFCIVFSNKFNIMSAFLSTTWLQKIDSREGLFWCKKRLACECSEMNIYLKKSPFAPTFGLFIAKYSAICR